MGNVNEVFEVYEVYLKQNLYVLPGFCVIIKNS